VVGTAAAVGARSLVIADTCQRRLPISVQLSKWEKHRGGSHGTGLAPADTNGLGAGPREGHRPGAGARLP